MNDRHFFADVDLPFHVWVRVQSGETGFRWVLRDARQGLPGAAERLSAGWSAPSASPGSSPRN
jgi:hypothetical protein